MFLPEAACLLATRWGERCGWGGCCWRRCWGLSQNTATSKTETAASNISHISAASSIGHIAKTNAADASIVCCTLLHQWPLCWLIVVATSCGSSSSSNTTTSISCSCVIVKVTIAVSHCEAFVVAVIIAGKTTVHLQLLLAVLWANCEATSQPRHTRDRDRDRDRGDIDELVSCLLACLIEYCLLIELKQI